MSKAPKASEALREAYDVAVATSCNSTMTGHLLRSIRHAERFEAEAAEGESVEVLMRECAELAGGERILIRYGDTFAAWVSRANLTAHHTGEHGAPDAALRALRSTLKPAAPGASWLDGASQHEIAKYLPDDVNEALRLLQPIAGDGLCMEVGTRFLAAHPELWEGKR